jgi:hypothetical protein
MGQHHWVWRKDLPFASAGPKEVTKRDGWVCTKCGWKGWQGKGSKPNPSGTVRGGGVPYPDCDEVIVQKVHES